jgi:hypothetical protein
MLLDLADELVGLFLRHLPAADHILNEVAGAFDHEAAQSGGRVHDIFHCRRHLAAGFQTDLMGLCRHLGDSILDVSSAVPWTSFWRRRRAAVHSYCRCGLGRFVVLSHHMLLIYLRSAKFEGRKYSHLSGCESGGRRCQAAGSI